MPKFKASSAALGILALAGLAFAGAVLKDKLSEKAQPKNPPAQAGKPSPPAGPIQFAPSSGTSLGGLVQSVQNARQARQNAQAGGGSFPAVPGVLMQIKIKPCVAQKALTGWEIESMGLAGLMDGETGLKPGDMFIAINGQGVLSVHELVQVCSTLQENQVCQFTVEHEGGGGTHLCQLTLLDPIQLAKQGPGGGP